MSISNKYEPGEFGYWWTIIKGKKDIEGVDYQTGIDVSCEDLTSLRGSPRSVGRGFWCNDNKLTSLRYCPEKVAGSFLCNNNLLTSLEYCPRSVGRSFYCGRNQLTSLKHCPQQIRESFWCQKNHLTNLKHGPSSIGGTFECADNDILDPLSDIIENNIIASDYVLTRDNHLTYDEIKEIIRQRAIKRQLGPFAITVPGGKL